MPAVAIEDLRRCLATAFERLELAPADADDLGALLIDSELRGHADHGAAALGILAGLYRAGSLNPRPALRVVRETASALVLDGDRGCGPAAPTRAMRWCIERARDRGVAAAAVRDWQLVVAGPWARLAAEAGLIGFACTNFNALVAPPGGRTAVFGTNPLAYALPVRGRAPVVLDMATTGTSMQKVRVAAEEGAALPEGFALDSAGRPTTDPAVALADGLLAPLGAPHAPHKGFGLVLLVDALGGVLSGSSFAGAVAGGAPGSFLLAVEVDAFMPRSEFLARMEAQVREVEQGERLPGVDELVVPGERGERRRRELSACGVVPLSAATWEIVARECAELGVPLPGPADRGPFG